MDEVEFKQAHGEFNDRPCVFTKAVLMRCAACSRAQRLYLAEREAVGCHSPGGHARCAQMLAELRDKALFALRQTQPEQVLPHAKEVKVECGGLSALRAALQPEAEAIDDIHALLLRATEVYGDMHHLPYPAMMQAISHYTLRKRTRRGGD